MFLIIRFHRLRNYIITCLRAFPRLAVKSAIVYGAVRYTVDKGVWADSDRTQKLYNEMCNSMCPHVTSLKKQLPIEFPLMPSSGEMCFVAKYYYNQGVKATFRFVHMMPCYLGQWAKKGKDALNKALDSPPAAATESKV